MSIQSNKAVREDFRKLLKQWYSPSISELAKAIDISYYSLLKWKNEQIDYSDESLRKIKVFLQNNLKGGF